MLFRLLHYTLYSYSILALQDYLTALENPDINRNKARKANLNELLVFFPSLKKNFF